MARHLLIAIATSEYPNLKPHDARPQLLAVVASVVDLFTGSLKRYQRVLGEIAENPKADTLRKGLDEWFAAAERDPSDWVVLYYTGHADVVGAESLYLLTSDFKPDRYVGTAFSLEQFADIVGATQGDGQARRVRNLLVIIDTCFAGEGTQQLTSRLAKIFRRNSDSSFYLLGAALPRQEAKAGALARALIESIEELSRRHVMQEWLFLEQIVPAINQRLRTHDAVWSAVASAREVPQFFPNPSFRDTAGMPVLASDARRWISDDELREHWGPRSRGVEFDNQPGSYFSGRTVVLDKLGAFLNSEHDHRTRVVVGRPGAGKSAILSRIVTRSLPGDAAQAGYGEHVAIPRFDLALHAKGKSLDQVQTRLAEVLGVEANTETILDHLRHTPKMTRIVIDALDEAIEPSVIAERLLAPMNGIASVKLMVGTRDTQLKPLGNAEVIDIDRPEHAEEDDIIRYVEERLLRRGEPGQATPYAGREVAAARVAEKVAEMAYPNFLVARLTVEDLLSRPKAVDPDSRREMVFPSQVADAFDRYLKRFGAKETLVRDVLRPLAYAEGQGLPWDNIWAPLATALSGREYGDEDIHWVLEHAGAFILEAAESGRSVYRLYHQALADAMRKGRRARDVQAVITKGLIASVPRLPDDTGADWLLASRYVRSHLATHAGRCGQLGKLVGKPLYLLAADPASLSREIATHENKVAGNLSALFRGTVHHIRREPPAIAGSYLELVARQRGLWDFADVASALPLPRPWSVPWAQWVPPTPSRSFGKGKSTIRALVVFSGAGADELLALVGRDDGAVEVWDVALDELQLRWRPDGVGSTWHLAVTETHEGPLLVAGWSTGHLGVLNPKTRDSVVRPDDTGVEGHATAMCIAERNGEPICLTAHDDLRLVAWELPSLRAVVEKRRATAAKIYKLRMVQDGGRPVLFSAGDHLQVGADAVDRSTIRLWSLDDLSLIWEDGRQVRAIPHHIEVGELYGRTVTVLSQNHWGPSQIWDLERRRLLFEGDEPSGHSWLYRFGRETLLLEASFEKFLSHRLMSEPVGERLSASEFGSPVDILGDRFSSIVRFYGRATFLSAAGDHVRVWDLEDLLHTAQLERRWRDATILPAMHVGGVNCLAAATRVPAQLYAGSMDWVIAFDASIGVGQWERQIEPKDGQRRFVKDLALSPDEDWVVAAMTDGSICILDPAARGATIREIITGGGMVGALRVGRLRDHSIVVANVSGRGGWATRVWELETGEEIPTDLAYRLMAGEEDKQLYGLAISENDTGLRIAFASKYGKVMVANFTGQRRYPAFKEWKLPHSTGEYVKSLATATCEGQVLLAAGTEYGHLAIWDFLSGDLKGSRASAHFGAVEQLCLGSIRGQQVLVSGGRDGMLRFWTAALEELFHIEIGEPIVAMAWTGPDRLAVGGRRGVLAVELRRP